MWLGPTKALAVAGVLASTGSAVVGARNLLTGQAEQARSIIPRAWDTPPRADGVYAPGGGPARRWERGANTDLHLMVFGDSTATGYGCRQADEVPGVCWPVGWPNRPDSRCGCRRRRLWARPRGAWQVRSTRCWWPDPRPMPR